MNENKKEDVKSAVKSQTKDAFKWWNDLSRIQPGDSFGKIIQRILIRLAGIVFLAVFSPALLLALIITFLLAL